MDLPIPLPGVAWRIPPDQRVLTEEGVHVYVECELPLSAHAELWLWLHNLITPEEVAERLAAEAQGFLSDL